jgi:predicted GNAT superfamily acetyltransferase
MEPVLAKTPAAKKKALIEDLLFIVVKRMKYFIRILESPKELTQVEVLQRLIWPGNETEVIPTHMLLAAVHNGGLVIGAYLQDVAAQGLSEVENPLVGFVFGIPGQYNTADGPRLKHHSHMLGVHPEHRNLGLGFKLKRAQWQMVRRQGIDRITWTYDPLLSMNAQLNIAKLGAVCNTYHVDYYGILQDQLNSGLPTDRFQVDWWVNSRRVNLRLSKQARPQLDLSHYVTANAILLNPSQQKNELSIPYSGDFALPYDLESILLIEIPANLQAIKATAPAIALEWRVQCRDLFQSAFAAGYIVTDFIRENNQNLQWQHRRCFYVLSHGDSTL